MTMKRLVVLLAAASLAAATVAAADGARFATAGTIANPNPSGKVGASLTETLNPCGAPHPMLGRLDGLDGAWIALPAFAPGQQARLEFDAFDMDVWFYTAGCARITAEQDPDAAGMATPPVLAGTPYPDVVGVEEGTIPVSAAYAFVSLAAGADEPFIFLIP